MSCEADIEFGLLSRGREKCGGEDDEDVECTYARRYLNLIGGMIRNGVCVQSKVLHDAFKSM